MRRNTGFALLYTLGLTLCLGLGPALGRSVEGGFVVMVDTEVNPDALDRFKQAAADNAKATIQLEPGCRQFLVLTPKDAPNHVVLVEVYKDESAREAHRGTPHFKKFIADTGPLVKGRKVTLLNALVRGEKED